jgi:hypothetical protein
MSKHPMMESYRGAKRRCEDVKHKNFIEYGGRGIRFKFDSFEDFHAHLGETWFKGATLERIDNEGSYEIGNLKWASRAEQCRNTRRSRYYSLDGTTMVLADWARSLGISPKTLDERIEKWGTEKALRMPRQDSYKQRILTYNEESLTITEWCKRLGISRASMLERLQKWPLDRALTTPRLRVC